MQCNNDKTSLTLYSHHINLNSFYTQISISRFLLASFSCAHVGMSKGQAQGQGIWSMFQLPSGRGKPEELYSHPIRESLEFSVVAVGTHSQQRLSLTFRYTAHIVKLFPVQPVPIALHPCAMRIKVFVMCVTICPNASTSKYLLLCLHV